MPNNKSFIRMYIYAHAFLIENKRRKTDEKYKKSFPNKRWGTIHPS